MNRDAMWRVVVILLLGQMVSLCLATTSFTSSFIAKLGVHTPLTQSLFTYISVAVVYGAVFLSKRRKLSVSWYWYIPLAIVDVQGNFLVVKAYQYSSITSVTLLDCWTIPWVMILTSLCLKTRYSRWQFVGAVICVVGLALVLVSDAGESAGGGMKPLFGDVLVIVGTFCYAFSNVGEEFLVKSGDFVEVSAMLGLFGVLISVLEISMLERKNLEVVTWSPTLICLFAAFAACGFLFYTGLALVLKMGGSTLFNLSLLTSDMWAVLIRIFFYHEQVSWLYFFSFGVVIVGLVIYSVNDTNPAAEEKFSDEEVADQCEPLVK